MKLEKVDYLLSSRRAHPTEDFKEPEERKNPRQCDWELGEGAFIATELLSYSLLMDWISLRSLL